MCKKYSNRFNSMRYSYILAIVWSTGSYLIYIYPTKSRTEECWVKSISHLWRDTWRKLVEKRVACGKDDKVFLRKQPWTLNIIYVLSNSKMRVFDWAPHLLDYYNISWRRCNFFLFSLEVNGRFRNQMR